MKRYLIAATFILTGCVCVDANIILALALLAAAWLMIPKGEKHG